MPAALEPTPSGPLTGLRVVELAGQGPGPYCGMLLADLGADVVAVDRPEVASRSDRSRPATNPMMRGKRSVALDLKSPSGTEAVHTMIDAADVFIDPFRPGVCERLGIGPEVVCARNERLIYGRMTGFGQEGPLASAAGHDIDYIALSGALHTIGYEGQPPTFPINLLGDFAGGGLLLALGVASAAYERSHSGRGQVIDAAMVDGAAMLLGPFFSATTSGYWGPRGTNHLDGAAPFYNVYETADAEWVAVGAIEPQFHRELYRRLEVEEPPQWDRASWPDTKALLATLFRTRSRAQWCELLEGHETCFAPVLAPGEVADHPHMAARGTVVEINGVVQAQAAPRFSRTPASAREPVHPGDHTVAEVLSSWS
jgi:alpha-methylacyl-CoA racemase